MKFLNIVFPFFGVCVWGVVVVGRDILLNTQVSWFFRNGLPLKISTEEYGNIGNSHCWYSLIWKIVFALNARTMKTSFSFRLITFKSYILPLYENKRCCTISKISHHIGISFFRGRTIWCRKFRRANTILRYILMLTFLKPQAHFLCIQ